MFVVQFSPCAVTSDGSHPGRGKSVRGPYFVQRAVDGQSHQGQVADAHWTEGCTAMFRDQAELNRNARHHVASALEVTSSEKSVPCNWSVRLWLGESSSKPRPRTTPLESLGATSTQWPIKRGHTTPSHDFLRTSRFGAFRFFASSLGDPAPALAKSTRSMTAFK